MIESGCFICKECGEKGMSTFTNWEKKENNYIFGKKFEFLDFSKPNWSDTKWKWTSGKTQKWDNENSEICWEETGGSTEDEWNKWSPWQCEKCKYKTSNFKDFIAI